MLAGIFYGAPYGGSTTAILVNLPGETSSVVTCIDGHQMARQVRAGPALAVAALASFFAGCVSTLLIATFAPPLAKVGQSFGAPEYFSLMVLGLIAAVVLAHGSVIKAIAMIILGLLIGLVGTDGNTGGTRFTFGIIELTDGIDVATLAIGVFGVGEIITNLRSEEHTSELQSRLHLVCRLLLEKKKTDVRAGRSLRMNPPDGTPATGLSTITTHTLQATICVSNITESRVTTSFDNPEISIVFAA